MRQRKVELPPRRVCTRKRQPGKHPKPAWAGGAQRQPTQAMHAAAAAWRMLICVSRGGLHALRSPVQASHQLDLHAGSAWGHSSAFAALPLALWWQQRSAVHITVAHIRQGFIRLFQGKQANTFRFWLPRSQRGSGPHPLASNTACVAAASSGAKADSG